MFVGVKNGQCDVCFSSTYIRVFFFASPFVNGERYRVGRGLKRRGDFSPIFQAPVCVSLISVWEGRKSKSFVLGAEPKKEEDGRLFQYKVDTCLNKQNIIRNIFNVLENKNTFNVSNFAVHYI